MVLIILLLVTLVLFALFLGGGLVAQGYFYQEPADRMPIRALAAAMLVGLFITGWVMIDRAAPRKYDTFFRFEPNETREINEFEAIRWLSVDGTRLKQDESGQRIEVAAKFKKGTGSKANTFVDEQTGDPFMLNSSGKSGDSYMTAALRAKPTSDAEPVRFDAQLKNDKGSTITYAAGLDGLRFVEENGSRYIQAHQLGVVYVPSTGAVIIALFINLLHLVVWFIAFWPILQFTRGHSFILMTVFGLVTMLVVMPLLFEKNRETKSAVEGTKVALVSRERLLLRDRSTSSERRFSERPEMVPPVAHAPGSPV